MILPREFYVGVVDLNHFAARRRNQWNSPDEMFERFKDRPPFNAWKPAVLRDYVDYGLLPNPNGDGLYPRLRAGIRSRQLQLWHGDQHLSRNRDPSDSGDDPARAAAVRTISSSTWRTRPPRPISPRSSRNAVDVPLPQYSHFIPMEAPELVAEYVRKLAESV